MEDKLLLIESRMKEMQKRQDEVGSLSEMVREKGRNILIVEEGLEKMKVKLQKLEEKLVKGNGSKLSKGEKSLMKTDFFPKFIKVSKCEFPKFIFHARTDILHDV